MWLLTRKNTTSWWNFFKKNLNIYYKYVQEFKVKHEDNEDINKNYKNNEMEFLELKNIISEMKNSLTGFTSTIHPAEEKINKLEDIAVKAIQTEAQRDKKFFK